MRRSDDASDSADAVSLAGRISAGDAEAERELVEHYAPLVERLLRMTVDRWHAEDLLQETMVSVIARLRRKRLDDPAGLEGYVKQTARKLILAAYRKSRPSFPISLELIDPRPAQLAMILRNESIARLRAALLRVQPVRYRQLLERYYLAEESKQTICADFGFTELHFNRVLFRARRRLRLELENIEVR